jgi:UDP-N-acetylmuramate: L-alanyl-gamma-D-glutamyl-meso-diaminopimelate ligase
MTAPNPRPFPALPDSIERVHVIGVCGTAMGTLAVMLTRLGLDVRGSDAMAYPPMSTWLAERGVEIMLGYDEKNLDWDPDLVVVGNVSRATYPDAVATRERGIPYVSLPEALRHFFMRDTRNLVVTGTHGKTTTTAMLAWILTHAGHDPSFLVGGIANNFGASFRLGDGPAFVIEGDEYDTAYFDKVPKFWHYAPSVATINNIEFDHADIYPDVASIEHVFRRFADLLPDDGALWVNGDDPRALAVSDHRAPIRRTFGLGQRCDLRAHSITHGATTRAEVTLDGDPLGTFEIQAPGEFNVRNLLGALALAMEQGVDPDTAREALSTFLAARKRQELVGEVDGVLVYDDFAHHPTAVGETLRAIRARHPDAKLWAIFEAKSNTSRRAVFQHAYPPSLSVADEVVLSKPWRKDEGLSPEELLDIDQLRADVEALGPPTSLEPEVDAIVARLAREVAPGDVVVGLSGSSFGGFHQKLVDALEAR